MTSSHALNPFLTAQTAFFSLADGPRYLGLHVCTDGFCQLYLETHYPFVFTCIDHNVSLPVIQDEGFYGLLDTTKPTSSQIKAYVKYINMYFF